jgi:hypothetical protein
MMQVTSERRDASASKFGLKRAFGGDISTLISFKRFNGAARPDCLSA